jgi:hypothetical protein
MERVRSIRAHACISIRPAADIGPISKGARCWGMSRRSYLVRGHHSK